MSKFKVGDKVQCVDNSHNGSHFKVDVAYVVTGYREEGPYKYVTLEGESGEWAATRFITSTIACPKNHYYSVHDDNFSGASGTAFHTIDEATAWIQDRGIAGHTYTVQESIERRKFEVVEKVQRELKAI